MQTIQLQPQVTRVRASVRVLASVTGFLITALDATGTAHAQTVNFSAVSLATVSSAAGQNFAAVNGTVVNVRLISGTPTTLQSGQSPDTNGFYALQNVSNLGSFTFRFTLSTPQTYQINQNETVTSYETNAFSMPSGTWNVLSSSNVTVTAIGSQVSFTGTLNTPPYGTYMIQGAGSSFDFTVNNQPGLGPSGSYGSAISLVLPSSSASAPEPGSVALLALAGLPVAGMIARRRRAA